jgi:hypothetical protein
MTLPTTITTQELCQATGYSAPAIVDFEKTGIVAREAKDTWPIDTVTKIVTHLREKVRRGPKSDAENRLIAAKAQALELRARRELSELAPVAEWLDGMKMITGKIVAALVGLPPRFTRDLAERARLENMINELRTDVANWIETEAANLEEAAKKSTKRRA